MFLPKLTQSFSPAKARGFFDVPSLNAALLSGDLLSGNLGEGASKNRPVVLFGRRNSIYRQFDLDVFDVLRDARTYTGDSPVIAHPPCRGWGRLRSLSKVLPGELDLAHFAVAAVRRCGGVLEHPAHSMLWPAAGLPAPGERDSFGGFTFPILQSWFGHGAPKPTWLYFVGLSPGDLPQFPFALGIPSGRVEFMSTAKREKTPFDLAVWLISAVSLVEENLFSRKVDKCRLLVSGSYVIPGQSALECIKC